MGTGVSRPCRRLARTGAEATSREAKCWTAPVQFDAARRAGDAPNDDDDFNDAGQDGVGRYQVTHKSGERRSAAKSCLTPVLGRANLTLMTNAQTTRVLLEGGHAVGVEARVGGELKRVMSRREGLLSAGALSHRNC